MCDYLGEKLAGLLGITSPKYQYAIDEYYRMRKEVSSNCINGYQLQGNRPMYLSSILFFGPKSQYVKYLFTHTFTQPRRDKMLLYLLCSLHRYIVYSQSSHSQSSIVNCRKRRRKKRTALLKRQRGTSTTMGARRVRHPEWNSRRPALHSLTSHLIWSQSLTLLPMLCTFLPLFPPKVFLLNRCQSFS